ncbi:MAG: MBL fold metallo-hydrolase [Dehalococcoidales bacterium]|nr:MBL fold metallo-hydrolase [Dehalococcoidales bacterium]
MQIKPGLYQITTGGINSVNSFLIVEEKLTLIDTGFGHSFRQIIGFIRNIGRSEQELSLIIITHNHPDHTGSLFKLKQITKARVAVHQADIGPLPYNSLTASLIKSLNRIGIGRNMRLDTTEIDIPLYGGEVLPVFDGLEVINTPGHTPGSISLFSPKYKIIFVGDLINNRYTRLRIPCRIINYDTSTVKKSLRQISNLDFDTLCIGHGKPIKHDAAFSVRKLAETL